MEDADEWLTRLGAPGGGFRWGPPSVVEASGAGGCCEGGDGPLVAGFSQAVVAGVAGEDEWLETEWWNVHSGKGVFTTTA